MGQVAALVLAAGRGSRFGAGPDTSKVFAELDGRALVAHAADIALGSRADLILPACAIMGAIFMVTGGGGFGLVGLTVVLGRKKKDGLGHSPEV